MRGRGGEVGDAGLGEELDGQAEVFGRGALHARPNASAIAGSGVGTPVMCTRLIAPAPVACAMWMQSSSVASPGGRSVPGQRGGESVDERDPHAVVLDRVRAGRRRRRRCASNSLGVSVTQSKPAAAAAAASSGKVDLRNV